MRWGGIVLGAVVASGCGFSVPSGTTADDDDESTTVTVTDDTASDFAAGTSTEATIAERGAIEPAGYVPNGLHGRGFIGQFVTGTSTYESVVASLPAQSGERYSVVPAEWAYDPGRPRGLGLTSGDNYTVMLDGELQLPAGDVTIALRGDDDVIMQVSLDGGSTWSALTYDNAVTADGQLPLVVPAEGWYPIRIAFDEAGGAASLHLLIGNTDIDASRLRAPASTAHGLQATTWQHFVFLNQRDDAWFPTIDQDFTDQAPAVDSGLTPDLYVLRYAGQLRIDTQGDYTFTVDQPTDDFYRLFIDDAVAITNYASQVVPSATLTLSPGWHDITFDYSEINGLARTRLVATGPDLAGAIPTDRLRPVQASGLVIGAVDTTSHIITDAGVMPAKTEVKLGLGKPNEGALTTLVDWGYNIDAHTPLTDLVVDLECPVTYRSAFDSNGDALALSNTACANMPAADEVTFRVTDSTAGGAPGYVFNAYAGLTYRGGVRRQPFPTKTSFTSSVKPMSGATEWGPVGLVVDARGATITLEVRAADDTASLPSAEWFPVIDGEVPAAPIGEVAQYRITIANDGWQLASIDRVDLRYVTP